MRAWKLYSDKLNKGFIIDNVKRAHLNRFNARYELAKNFEKVELANTSAETMGGYSSIFAVFLAFNAAEKLGSIEGFREINSWELSDKNLANELRLVLHTLNDVAEEFLDYQKAVDKLEEFIKCETDNVRIPASVIRNSFAHGSLTPHILNATTKKNQKSLFDLSRKLLVESEQLYTEWVNSL